MPLSFLFGSKPSQPVQPSDLTPANPYDIGRLTPQQWSELYQSPKLREMQQRIYPGQDRWDHPELDEAVIQAAVDRVREQVHMNTMKTSAHQGAVTALAQFGIKTAFFPDMSPEDEASYEPGYAPQAAGGAGVLGFLGSRYSGGSMPEALGLMSLLHAGVGGATAAAEAPSGDRLRHGLYAAGGSLGGAGVGAAGGGLAGAGLGAGGGALLNLLLGGKMPMPQAMATGAGVGAMVGSASGAARGATSGLAYGQQKAQQHSKNKAAKKPAGGKPGRDGDGDGKKNEAKKAKTEGEKKAFEMFFGKQAGLDLWDPESGAVMNGTGGTRGSNLGTAVGAPSAAPATPRKFTMEDLLMAKKQLAASGVPAGGLRAAARPMAAPAAAPRLPVRPMPVKLGGAEDALAAFGLKEAGIMGRIGGFAGKALNLGGRALGTLTGPVGGGISALGGAIQGFANGEGLKGAVGRAGINFATGSIPGGAGLAAGVAGDALANKMFAPKTPAMGGVSA